MQARLLDRPGAFGGQSSHPGRHPLRPALWVRLSFALPGQLPGKVQVAGPGRGDRQVEYPRGAGEAGNRQDRVAEDSAQLLQPRLLGRRIGACVQAGDVADHLQVHRLTPGHYLQDIRCLAQFLVRLVEVAPPRVQRSIGWGCSTT